MGCLNSVPEEPRESAIGQTIKNCRIIRQYEEKDKGGNGRATGTLLESNWNLGMAGMFLLYKAAGDDPHIASFFTRGYEIAVGGDVKREHFESFMQGAGVPTDPDHFSAVAQYLKNRVISTLEFGNVQYSAEEGNLKMTFDGYPERELVSHPSHGFAICKVRAQARYPPVDD